MYEGLKKLEVPHAPKGERRRWLRIVLMGALVAGLGFAGMSVYTYTKVKGNLGKGVVEELRVVVEKALPNEPLNILVLGSDSREGVTPKDKRKGLGGPEGQRADVIMLLHIYANGKKAALVSIPRDLRVEIPGHGTSKINSAFAWGGSRLMIKTVRRLTGIKVNHFIEVNFFGFRGIVNAVKGVPVVVDREIHDDKAKLDIPGPGCWVLDGNEALAFVRARMFDPTADIGRIQRQQAFLRSMAKRVGSIGVLLNPTSLDRISNQIGTYFRYDPALVEGRTFGRARAIAAALASVDQRRLDFRIVPNYADLIDGISYLIPREDEMDALFAALKADKALPSFGKTSESVPERGDVSVQVLNGTRKPGLATKQSKKLGNKGFQMSSPANDRPRARTLIRYEAEDELKVALIRGFYKGARLKRVEADMSTDIQVVIGKDFLRKDEDPDPLPTPTPAPALRCRELK